jgi:hypothetical protein
MAKSWTWLPAKVQAERAALTKAAPCFGSKAAQRGGAAAQMLFIEPVEVTG